MVALLILLRLYGVHVEIQDPNVGFVTFGISTGARLLVVAHTDRDDTIRIISARLVTPGERKIYEEG